MLDTGTILGLSGGIGRLGGCIMASAAMMPATVMHVRKIAIDSVNHDKYQPCNKADDGWMLNG